MVKYKRYFRTRRAPYTVAVASFILEGSIFLLPSLQGREADNMEYITLTELLLIIGTFIAFADLLLSFFNDDDKK